MSIILANKIGKCLFLSGAIFLLVGFIWAQTPSVEVSLYSEPDLTNLAVVQTENSVKISVRAFDVSGIYNVVAIISDSRGDEKERVILYDDGNHDDGTAGDTIYGNSVLLVGYPPGVFWISLFAIDNFAFRKDVVRVVSFELVSNCKIAVPENASAQTQFEIDVSESPGSDRISQARFSSDDSQDETASGVWTDWFDWTGSSGDWDSARKIMKWSLNEAGDYEIWAEIKDTASNVFSCFDTTRVQANCQTSEGLTICLNVVTTGFSETQILSFASDKPLVSSGDTIDLSAVLRYRFGETIAGEKINFVDTTDSLILCPAVLTNDQGVASCSYQIPLTMTRQFHVLKAEYLGSCVLGTNPSQNSSVSITVANAIPSVIAVLITPSPNAFSHETLVCSFIVSDSDTTDVLSADITWEKRANAGASWTAWVSDDETINSVPNGVSRSTSSAGNIEPADTNYEEQWRCKATGRDNQGGASASVYSQPVVIASQTKIDPFTANKTNVASGDTINLSATLKYQVSNNPINNENLNFLIGADQTCGNRKTNGQGKADCSYNIPYKNCYCRGSSLICDNPLSGSGNKTLKAQYLGNRSLLAEPVENSSLSLLVNIISTGPTECGPVCGDRSCERGETCDVCPADCGPCGPVCGNGICEPGEDWLSCPADPCPAPYCGDGNCDRGEDCTWCWDCGWCWPEPHGVPFWLF